MVKMAVSDELLFTPSTGGGTSEQGLCRAGGGGTKYAQITHAPEPEMRSILPEERETMPEWRCRMHGGKATGAPKENRNVWKHGYHSAKERALRLTMTMLSRKLILNR
jgi:hypothetical protein